MATTRTITFLINGNETVSAAVNAAKNALNNLRGATGKMSALQRSLGRAQDLQKLIGDYRSLQRAINASQAAQAKNLLQASRMSAAQSQAVKQLDAMRDAMKNLRQYQRGERAKLDVDKTSVARLKSALQQNEREMGAYAARVMRQQIRAAEKDIRAREKSLDSIWRGATRELENQKAAVKNFGAGFESANAKAQQLRANLQQLTANSQQLKARLAAQGLGGGVLAGHEMQLRSQIQQTIHAINQETEALNRRNAAAQRFSTAQQDFANAYSNFQNAMQTAGTIINPFVNATETAMSFEYAMSRVKALTQMRNLKEGNLAAVEQEMKLLTEQAKHLGETTEFTQVEAAQAQGFLGMAGWSTDKILAAMPTVLDVTSITGDHNLARTADIFSNIMTAMHLKPGQLMEVNGKMIEATQHFGDAMAFALTQSNMNRENFFEAMKYSAPIAATAGLSAGEQIATNMVVASSGLQGSMAGTGFRSGLLTLAGANKKAQAALEEVGMASSDAQKQLAEAQDTMNSLGVTGTNFSQRVLQLGEAFAGMTQDEKLTNAYKIFGKNAATFWAQFLSSDSLKDFAKFANEIDSGYVEGWNAQTAAVMRDNTQTQIEYVKSAFDALMTSIGNAFLGGTSNAAQGLAELIMKLNEFVKENETAIQYAGLLAAALATIVVVGAGLAAVSAAIGVIASGLALLAPLATLAGAAFAFLTSPIFLVAAAVAAFIALLVVVINHADQIKQALSDAWNHPKGAVIGFCELIKSAISSAVDFVLAQWLTLKSALAHPIEAAINFAKTGSVVGGNVVNGAQQVKTMRMLTPREAKSYELPTYQPYNFYADRTGGAFQVQNAQIAAAQVQVPPIETPKIEAPQVDVPKIESPTIEVPELPANSYELTAKIPPVDTSAIQSSFDAASFSTQNLSNALLMASPATQALAMSTQMAATNSDALSAATQTATGGVNAMSTAAQASTGSVNAMSVAASASTGNISSMAGASSSAAGSISGLGAAAASAIGALMSAGASAAAAVHGAIGSAIAGAINAGHASVAQNAAGGIYSQGAFLTTFAEKSPEAAIPIDSSARAKNLWLETGNLLGMFPNSQQLEANSSVTVNVNMTFNGADKPENNSWIDDVREVFAELAEQYFSDKRRISYA